MGGTGACYVSLSTAREFKRLRLLLLFFIFRRAQSNKRKLVFFFLLRVHKTQNTVRMMSIGREYSLKIFSTSRFWPARAHTLSGVKYRFCQIRTPNRGNVPPTGDSCILFYVVIIPRYNTFRVYTSMCQQRVNVNQKG